MAKIWTDDNKYADVTTIEQALWNLKMMRSSIKLHRKSSNIQEEDMEIDRVQEQALTVAINYINQKMNEKANK